MKRLSLSVIFLISVIAVIHAVFNTIRPSVKRHSIRTAKVERGDVKETILASGKVVPAFEEVITSPIDTKVLKVLKQPGDLIQVGDRLLLLDTSETRLAFGKLDEQILVKKNEKAKIRVDVEEKLNDLRSKSECKKLRLASNRKRYQRYQKLHDFGGVSGEELREVKLEMDITRIELERLEKAIKNAGKSAENKLNEIELEIAMLIKDKQETARKIDLADTKVIRKSVLTWIVEEPGTALSKGDVFARMADLNSFKIKGTVSDVHASDMMAGLLVLVRINDDHMLDGTIASVLPDIDNGILTFMVDIKDNTDPRLRSNLRTDIYVIKSHRFNVPRIQKGAFAQGKGVHEVFLVRGDRAVKTAARFGISGFEHYEIVDGLPVGSEVIISDMKDHLYADNVIIR